MTEIILTKEESDTLLFTFGYLIWRKSEQTKWVLANKEIEPDKKPRMEENIKNYDSILKKIGYENRSTKKNPTIFSFKKSRPFKQN